MAIKIKSQSGYSDFYINQLKINASLVLKKRYITQITDFGTFLLPDLAPFYYRCWQNCSLYWLFEFLLNDFDEFLRVISHIQWNV
jgi:hypothetical protein